MNYGVSVVIPTLNREEYLANTVQKLLRQDYNKFEIIIVDQSDKKNEEVYELSKKYTEKIRYYWNVGFKGLPQARNFGWQKANYEIILYVDDDIIPYDNLIKNHAKCYENKEIGLVAGGIEEKYRKEKDEPTGEFNFWTATPYRGFNKKEDKYVFHVPGGNFSIKKEVIFKINGVDEILNIGAALYEETELSLRAKKEGYKIYFKADARLLHLAAESGGCRVKDIPKYMFGLAHNRTIIIDRYLKIYNKPIAYLRLLMLGLSYSKNIKSLKPFIETLKGIRLGKIHAKQNIKCSKFEG